MPYRLFRCRYHEKAQRRFTFGAFRGTCYTHIFGRERLPANTPHYHCSAAESPAYSQGFSKVSSTTACWQPISASARDKMQGAHRWLLRQPRHWSLRHFKRPVYDESDCWRCLMTLSAFSFCQAALHLLRPFHGFWPASHRRRLGSVGRRRPDDKRARHRQSTSFSAAPSAVAHGSARAAAGIIVRLTRRSLSGISDSREFHSRHAFLSPPSARDRPSLQRH